MQVQLDHTQWLETTVLRGSTALVAAFADAVCAERGVHHGKLNLVSVMSQQPDQHGPEQAAHLHLKPAH